MRKQSKQVIHTQIMHAHRLFLQRAMNWEKMFLSGAITHGQTLQLQYKEKAKTTLRHAEILMDGSVKLDNGIIFARPSQARPKPQTQQPRFISTASFRDGLFRFLQGNIHSLPSPASPIMTCHRYSCRMDGRPRCMTEQP